MFIEQRQRSKKEIRFHVCFCSVQMNHNIFVQNLNLIARERLFCTVWRSISYVCEWLCAYVCVCPQVFTWSTSTCSERLVAVRVRYVNRRLAELVWELGMNSTGLKHALSFPAQACVLYLYETILNWSTPLYSPPCFVHEYHIPLLTTAFMGIGVDDRIFCFGNACNIF